MEAADAEKWIREHIEVTRQKVTIAKAFVVEKFAAYWPWNGRCPQTISYSTTPSAHTSERLSILFQ